MKEGFNPDLVRPISKDINELKRMRKYYFRKIEEGHEEFKPKIKPLESAIEALKLIRELEWDHVLYIRTAKEYEKSKEQEENQVVHLNEVGVL